MGIRIGFNPAASTTHAGMGGWAGPGGGAPQGFALGGPGYGYNPDIVAANAPAVNTGNEFGMGVPRFAPSQWGTFDVPTLSPTIGFNNQPYVETFNAGFPAQMNPAYNIDNIQQPSNPSNPFAWSNLGLPSNITSNYFNTPVRNPFSWSNLGMGPDQ